MDSTPPRKPATVICCGQVVLDHTFRVDEVQAPPSKTTARGYNLGIGGMGAHAAIAVVRLGGRALFWGRVGDDEAGAAQAEALDAEGVDVTHLRRIPGAHSALSAVIVDKMGERAIVTYRGDGLSPDPSWLPLDLLAEAGAVLTDPRWPEGSHVVLDAAAAIGLPTVLDAEKSEARILRDLVPRVGHAIFAATGLSVFGGGAPPRESLRRALASGPLKMVAVTRGEDSTLWMVPGDDKPREMPAFPVQATNTTGAGDVFHGAYALAMAEGQGIEAALRFASAAGALRARDGATPDRAMVEALIGTLIAA
ncbi:PfkB family carbohydrate kinase [Humitalea sp. 24SJ18S-53]|uniref:PfkB family carbohydrate kinase n=1 Tax=Humitalea sp. 24SJ18S-53 TaxID=3422307 RepID=UPI003D6762D4